MLLSPGTSRLLPDVLGMVLFCSPRAELRDDAAEAIVQHEVAVGLQHDSADAVLIQACSEVL